MATMPGAPAEDQDDEIAGGSTRPVVGRVPGPTPNARSRPAPTSQPLSLHNLAAVGVLAEGALGGR